MADVTVSYKGQTICELSSSGSKTLKTQKKYCEGDISLNYVKPQGSVAYILVKSNKLATLTCGSQTYTLTGSETEHSFAVELGTYTITSTKESYTTSKNVVVSQYAGYYAELYPVPSPIPVEYQEVEWIGFSGTQYIDTGLFISINTILEFDIMFNSLVNARWFGTNDDCILATNNNIIPTDVMGQWNDDWVDPKLSTGIKYNVVVDYESGNYKLYVDDIAKQDKNVTMGTTTKTAWIGMVNDSAYREQLISNFKLYKFNCKKNNQVVKNYIPCYRKYDGVIGVYDTINKVFLENEGTGTFTKGEDV